MITDPRPVVVAGIDGSARSLAAARWAAEEARRRQQSLQLLHSTHLPVIGYPAFGYPAEFIEEIENQGQQVLDQAVRELHRDHPELTVDTVLTRTDPRVALVEASDGAALTVVGSLGGGRTREVMLGSVALHVAAHGRSPVAVVPDDRRPRRGPVLLGVDGRADSEPAVGYAYDEASVRGVDLVAVLTFDPWARQGFARRPITIAASETQEERALISEQLAGWAQKYPDVRVHEHVFRGQPADCLLGYAAHGPVAQQPQLIVVGSRGRGALTGLLLGSTSHAVIANAGCPVVVVRPSAH